MISNVDNHLDGALPRATTSSPTDVQEFQGLLKASMTKPIDEQPGQLGNHFFSGLSTPEQGDLLEQTALRVHLSEQQIGKLQAATKQGVQELRLAHNTEGDVARAMTFAKYAASSYFVSVAVVESTSQDAAEEIDTLKRST